MRTEKPAGRRWRSGPASGGSSTCGSNRLTSRSGGRRLCLMDLTRRELLASMGGFVAAAAYSGHTPLVASPPFARPGGDPLPARGDFAIPSGQTYLNSAFIHPVPVAAANAVRSYLETRTFREPRRRSGDELAAEVKAEFAALINAKPAEISLVQSTSVAENLVVNGLGLPGSRGKVVTDALHFDGSLVLYGELARHGLGLTIVRPRDWRIEL